MFVRHLTPCLLDRVASQPVVTLVGPRQSGKTTLVRQALPDHGYINLERPDHRSQAREDPLGLLASHPDGVILDEVHRVPDLLSYIQVSVDEDDRPGRFVLTGSQNFLLMEKVTQTLAGRTALLRLLPLSLTELMGRSPIEPDRLDEAGSDAGEVTDDLWTVLWRGFYPRIHDKGLNPDVWLADYQSTYVERDVRDVLRIMDLDAFERFVRLCTARTGQELNMTSLAEDVGISQPTARAWLTAMRVSSLVTLLTPHHANFRKRLRKSPKLHFLDSGLACYLLGITGPDVLRNHPLRGAIFESFIVSELIKSFEHAGRQAPLFYWKDRTGHEIDVLMDLGDRLVPIEIKSAQTVSDEALEGLRWWLGLKDNPNRTAVLIHGGERLTQQGPVTIRPWNLA